MSRPTAVVTGASKGLGLALSRMLFQSGYRVFGLCRTSVPLEEVDWIPCDVTDPASVDEAFSRILAQTEAVDLLICNAGMGISGAAEFARAEDVNRQMTVNFTGAWQCTRAVIPSMRSQGKGRILFVSSLGGLFPLPFQGFYSASKAALTSFSDSLGLEVTPFGIQTCALLLNDVKTEFTDNRLKNHMGSDLYGGRIDRAVSKMEVSERRGLSPEKIARCTDRLLRRRKLPPHAIFGFSNKLLVLLSRLLPTRCIFWLLSRIYC